MGGKGLWIWDRGCLVYSCRPRGRIGRDRDTLARFIPESRPRRRRYTYRMSDSNLVRFSRDGDQFHYLWAARRCLALLLPASGLVAVTIEGASTHETEPRNAIIAGDALIDVGEYFGSERIEDATRVHYIQLKHSTAHPTDPWLPSGMENTVKGFAARYKALIQQLGPDQTAQKVHFSFVSNRPISKTFAETVSDAASGTAPRHPNDLKKLETFTGLSGRELGAFCELLHLDGGEDAYWIQRYILDHEVSGYLPDADRDAPIKLKELVTRKALSESARDRSITKIDVSRALGADESLLFPAPCLIKPDTTTIVREQEADLVGEIVRAARQSIIIYADAGVGKSVFATHIAGKLPDGSCCVVYDCFGDGQYRNPSAFRHRCKDGLVQIANELASRTLCHPLIPTSHADASAYVKAFLHRLKQASTCLRAQWADAVLCVVVDAADNAEIAAQEYQEGYSFIRILLREELPEGVCVVALCRPHRVALLNPPPETRTCELRPFSRVETATHLRHVFPNATERDVDEFHRLSSHNPHIQATALSRKMLLSGILRSLGPDPTTIGDTLQRLLDRAIADLRDKAGSIEGAQIDRICAGLALLRPLIPIGVLAKIANVHESAVRSFAFDLGRPLVVTGSSIQFFDEPAETWFRERFKPSPTQLATFLDILKPIATNSAYVAAVLPQLLLEANQLSTLVELALSSAGLPDSSPIERRDVELQRLQFALRATLRARQYNDAAKLAFKAAVEFAGEDRQEKLLQENTDLGSVLLDPDRIQELVSRRTFGSGWIGSHHAYEAGLMSGRAELRGDARSRLRMAHEWVMNWSKLSADEREKEPLSDRDIAEMAWAQCNVHGPQACAAELRSWTPREVSFRSGRLIARRLIDHARYSDLDRLAFAADNNLCLILALVMELQEVHRHLPAQVVARALRLLRSSRVNLNDHGARPWEYEGTALHAVTALVEAAIEVGVGRRAELASILARYLPPSPPHSLASRFGGGHRFVRAYALEATLANRALEPIDLAHPELRKQMESRRGELHTAEFREFDEMIGPLLPWYVLWARTSHITAIARRSVRGNRCHPSGFD